MTNEEEKRIKDIEARQNELESQVKRAESNLFDLLTAYWLQLRAKPAQHLTKVWRQFTAQTWSPLFVQYTADLQFVLGVNKTYFDQYKDDPRWESMIKTVDDRVGERFGFNAAGEMVEGGYLDTLINDPTIKRQVSQFFFKTRAKKDGAKLRYELSDLVRGVEQKGGVVDSYFRNYAFDTYQEADRMTQNEYAQELGLEATIYTGGVIAGSREFCRLRSGKIFTREEVRLFGTSADKFGGYTDKAAGKFAGKPKNGYDPMVSAGGHGCRHHYSWVAKELAVRLDGSLEIVGGKLKRIKN